MTAPYRTAVSGERLADRYELLHHIDSGGMAEVWEAVDHTLGRTVAVKILHAHLARDKAFLHRFRREAINAARLQHPTIVAIYDAVSFDGLEAIVMERIDGRTLRSVLDEHSRLPARDVLDLGRQISQALTVAHGAGVIHRDIKPSNIMLCEDRRIKVTDFGIAKAGEDSDLTRTGSLLGTAKYLSPEQVLGEEVDARSDLYGLGVVLFEALAGQPPFDEGNDYATAQARVVSVAPRLSQFRPDLPAALDELIGSLLQQEPDNRPDSAAQLAVLLSGIRIFSEELAPESIPGYDRTTIDLRPATPQSERPSTGELKTPRSRSSRRRSGRQNPDAPNENGAPARAAAAGTSQATDAPASADKTFIGAHGGPVSDGGAETGEFALQPDGDQSTNEAGRSGLVGSAVSPSKIAVFLLVTGTLLLVALLVSRFNQARDTTEAEGGSSAAPAAQTDDTVILTPVQEFGPPVIAVGQAVDPLGDGVEMDERAGLAIDGEGDTVWITEKYSKPGFSSVKPGVGYMVTLVDPSVIDRVEFESRTQDWQAEVYVGSTAGEGPEGWDDGPFTVETTDDGGRVDLDGVTGQYVLLWITFEGRSEADPDWDGFENEPVQNRFALAELTIK